MEIDETESSNLQHTLYVSNLNEKIKQEDLKKSMKCIFSQFGSIVDVVSRRTYKLRGQAWVVFEDPKDAAKALKAMQGFPFFNKPIRIAYAKAKSDATAKLDGTYNEEEVENRKKRRRDMQAENGHPGTVAEVEANKPKPQASSANAPMSNQTLFVENLPKEANEGMLLLVFQKFPGLKEVRLVPHKPGIAFVEYDNEQGASAAMVGLQGFKLATDKPMAISFAKR